MIASVARPIEAPAGSAIATLTAPEAYIVLNGLKAEPVRALKLAFTQLITSGHLRIDGKRDPRIAVVSGKQQELPRVLYAVWLTLATQARTQRNGLPLSGLGTLVRERWGSRGINYVLGDILPALRARGLYAEERYRLLRIFPMRRTVLTPPGEEVRAELERLERLSRGGPKRWNREMPGGAAGFVALAGATIFLFDQDGRFVKELMTVEQTKAGAHIGNLSSIGGESLEATDNILSIDWGNLDILGSLDSFFDSFDSLDSGGDFGSDGGGDSGGDSGGGDGGGGGGE